MVGKFSRKQVIVIQFLERKIREKERESLLVIERVEKGRCKSYLNNITLLISVNLC